jgi:hypothetical protein
MSRDATIDPQRYRPPVLRAIGELVRVGEAVPYLLTVPRLKATDRMIGLTGTRKVPGSSFFSGGRTHRSPLLLPEEESWSVSAGQHSRRTLRMVGSGPIGGAVSCGDREGGGHE